jgi:hypothetical protein
MKPLLQHLLNNINTGKIIFFRPPRGMSLSLMSRPITKSVINMKPLLQQIINTVKPLFISPKGCTVNA